MGWISPTGHNDPDGDWSYETRAYDDDLVKWAYENGTGYLELTHAALLCDKVRFYTEGWYGTHTLDLDVYYGGAWHNIYSANPPEDQWVEVAIGSTESVTAARVKASSSSNVHLFNELDFNEVISPTYIPKVIMVD